MPRRVRYAAIGALLALVPSGAAAQVRVNVHLDSTGTPGSAEVLLWQGDTVFRAFTTPAGHAVLPSGDPRQAGTLLVRRLGYKAARLSLPIRDSIVTVILYPFVASRLATVTINAPQPDCRQPEDSVARRIWAETAERYSSVTGVRGFAAWGILRLGDVARDSVGLSGSGRSLTDDSARVATSVSLRGGRSDAVSRAVYATRLRHGPQSSNSLDGLFLAWSYRTLHSTLASHFATPGFGDRVTFAIEERTPAAALLRFCSRAHRRPYISGHMAIRNGRFEHADWSFVTDEPSEEAEGAAVFGEWVADDARPHLVALWGVFSRRVGRTNRSMQEIATAWRWMLSVDSTSPRGDIR